MNSKSIKTESPLNQVDLNELLHSKVLQINECLFKGYVIVRGDSSSSQFMAACEKSLGLALPTDANTLNQRSDLEALWYGPDEWLIICDGDQVDRVIEKLKSVLDGVHSSVVDISGGNTMLEISGVSARDLLAKGSPFDFHPTVFTLGDCAQTVMAKTNATLYPVRDGNTFRLIVRRSFADYLGVWLLDAAKEFTPN